MSDNGPGFINELKTSMTWDQWHQLKSLDSIITEKKDLSECKYVIPRNFSSNFVCSDGRLATYYECKDIRGTNICVPYAIGEYCGGTFFY